MNKERLMIALRDASPHPRAVVIMHLDAGVADFAVEYTRRFDYLASRTDFAVHAYVIPVRWLWACIRPICLLAAILFYLMLILGLNHALVGRRRHGVKLRRKFFLTLAALIRLQAA